MRERIEAARAVRRPRVDAIEHEGMKVGRQVQGRTEALDERDCAAASVANVDETSRTAPIVGKNGSHEAAQDDGRPLRVPGAAVSKQIGKRENPLSDRDLGQDAIDEMGGGIGHPPTAAGGTEAAAFAGEGDEPVAAAAVAMDANESMGEDATRETGADLALDEAGDGRAHRSRSGEEWQEIRANDFVGRRLLGLVANVVGDGGSSAGTGLK